MDCNDRDGGAKQPSYYIAVTIRKHSLSKQIDLKLRNRVFCPQCGIYLATSQAKISEKKFTGLFGSFFTTSYNL